MMHFPAAPLALFRVIWIAWSVAYPQGVRAALPWGGRLQRRDVDGAIRRSRADDRRLEGGRDGPRSRGTAASVTAGCQQWRWAPANGAKRAAWLKATA